MQKKERHWNFLQFHILSNGDETETFGMAATNASYTQDEEGEYWRRVSRELETGKLQTYFRIKSGVLWGSTTALIGSL